MARALLARASQGSRLHLWYSVAQWPCAEVRREAFESPSDDPEASEQMNEAIAEHLPVVVLDITADFPVA